MIYIIKEYDKNKKTAVNKPRLDSYLIIKEKFNIKELNWSIHSKKDVILKFPIQFMNTLLKMNKSDIVILQYPYAYSANKLFGIILKILKLKGVKIINLIHDIESLRYRDSSNKKRELEILNQSDVIISHNKYMTKWLNENGIDKNIVELNIFDYLCNVEKVKVPQFDDSIVFAGNLNPEKSGFIYKVKDIKNIKWKLYGPNYIDINNDCYQGSYKPEELVNIINKGFGLIWDGNDTDKCSGYTGEYLKYNNPYKLSSYMACGIPVITWKEAAISDFIIDNNIGIVVDSLHDLKYKIENIDKIKYDEMVSNVKQIREKIIKGVYLTEAINNGLDIIDLKN